MWFNIDPRSSMPIYQQLIEGVKGAVAKGTLTPGEKLPSVRELAGQITINHNTIAKAYQELEREGIIETLRGRGTFVAEQRMTLSREERKQVIKGMLERMLVEAHYLQLEEEELLEILEESVREWYRERREQT
ncbi:GntR family transcriptional regulator [Tumebacillus avium]|uniref:GntR family transcriptional regulator n=1 Tax=Tumebacillus avium TaxID=1903704 RepID=A0A1Y0INB3_9BACL|nr:GntR family transcriptional regulator [Tumebacillus avium]ARU60834.1 GntR family transcriptional regulator [Tumebacillus avium]